MAEGELKSIETADDWLKICGDEPARDMLFVVELYAAWCGASMATLSTYRKIREANEAKKFKLCKMCVNTIMEDLQTQEKASPFPLDKYEVQPKPTFVLFKDGELVATIEGVSMPTLEKLIAEHMPEGLLEEEDEAADDEEQEDA